MSGINLSIYEEPRFYFIPCSVLDCYLSMFCGNPTFQIYGEM